MSRFEPPDEDLSVADTCICGSPSVDEDGEPVCQEAPGYCPKPCQDQYMTCMGEQAAAEHAQLEYEKYLVAAEAKMLVEDVTGSCLHEHIYLSGGYVRNDGVLVVNVGCKECGTDGSTTITFDEVLW